MRPACATTTNLLRGKHVVGTPAGMLLMMRLRQRRRCRQRRQRWRRRWRSLLRRLHGGREWLLLHGCKGLRHRLSHHLRRDMGAACGGLRRGQLWGGGWCLVRNWLCSQPRKNEAQPRAPLRTSSSQSKRSWTSHGRGRRVLLRPQLRTLRPVSSTNTQAIMCDSQRQRTAALSPDERAG